MRLACAALGLSPNTVRKYADAGLIKCVKNAANQRLLDVDSFVRKSSTYYSVPSVVCYCRVSSSEQKDDLAKQVIHMRQQFPEAEIIKDIGKGLSLKRKGLVTLLDRLLQGEKLTVIVTSKDRLVRFGVDLFEYIINKNGGELLVVSESKQDIDPKLS